MLYLSILILSINLFSALLSPGFFLISFAAVDCVIFIALLKTTKLSNIFYSLFLLHFEEMRHANVMYFCQYRKTKWFSTVE